MRNILLIVSTGVLVLLGCSLGLAQRKDAPRRIEITGDASKVRNVLIKRQIDQGWELGDEAENSNRITFHEHLAGWRRALSELHYRYKFVLASSGGSTTLYGTYEECQDKAETDCRIITSKAAIARLDTLLDAIKVLVEAQ